MAAVRLRKIKQEYGSRVKIHWRYCPLAVVPRSEARISPHSIEGRELANLEAEDIHFNPWQEDVPYPVTSMPALRAAACALRQSESAFERLHIGIFKTFFEECRCIDETELLFELAKQSGVDFDKFCADFREASVDEEIMADYREYQDNFTGWGVPLVIIDGRFPLVGAVPLEMYRRAIDLALGLKKSSD